VATNKATIVALEHNRERIATTVAVYVAKILVGHRRHPLIMHKVA